MPKKQAGDRAVTEDVCLTANTFFTGLEYCDVFFAFSNYLGSFIFSGWSTLAGLLYCNG